MVTKTFLFGPTTDRQVIGGVALGVTYKVERYLVFYILGNPAVVTVLFQSERRLANNRLANNATRPSIR